MLGIESYSESAKVAQPCLTCTYRRWLARYTTDFKSRTHGVSPSVDFNLRETSHAYVGCRVSNPVRFQVRFVL